MPNPLALKTAARLEVEDRLYRALAVFRVVVTLNMLGLTLWRWDNFTRPGWTVVAVVAIVVWTAWVHVLSLRAERRTTVVHVVDLALSLLSLVITPWLKGPDFNASLPGFWVMGAVLAWAVRWHWRGGLVAATAVSVVDLAIRPQITQTNYGNVFLLMLGGALIGYMCESLQVMAGERAVAERRAAVAGERARLARAVHDGVLQVLALVQRKGTAGDDEWSRLAVLAGEQEVALRALIHAQDAWTTVSAPAPATRTTGGTPGAGPVGLRDLSGALEQGVGPTVTVATPGRPVVLPGEAVDAVLGAVGACLDNVRLHVGMAAPAWVFLEDHGDQVVVTVRDEGPGIPEGRLAQAREQGRLGVQSSICGRMAEVGGRAQVHTGEWGTEWELCVPRRSTDAGGLS